MDPMFLLMAAYQVMMGQGKLPPPAPAAAQRARPHEEQRVTPYYSPMLSQPAPDNSPMLSGRRMTTDVGSTQTLKIVNIDGNNPIGSELTRIVLNKFLKQNVEFSSTENGYEGLELIAEIKPDLVILDFANLGLDGYWSWACLTKQTHNR